VLSSVYEGLPTVLIEALALGVPIVSTDCPSGPSEILSNSRLGTLVPIGDIDAMADAMYKAITTKHSKPDDTTWAKFTVSAATAEYIDALFPSNSPHLTL
jgi:glycosyltransferase involved in cell wall biosynthesis